MSRISAPARLPWIASLASRALTWRFGKPFPTLALLSHHPAYPVPYLFITGLYVNSSTQLNSTTKALVSHLVAQLNGCAFCIDLGERVAQGKGLDATKLKWVLEFRVRPEYSAAERAALEYAWEATQVTARVSDEVYATLTRFYTEREIIELTVAVATENFFNRLTRPLNIESQGFCALMDHPE
ncbi:carboxymuconolactone decarboxylase family protein [Deinococcus hopiensis]|uniref:Alkylhydroperoxidase AhpD family core domain-containing protein n=1 Tax=Deinococcus hopiensis KR-140 TaxID=695939 RepID=A0A1W1UT88_9DEIO|nr:carboxymuconolactone decarboxylase family protein [Deinococcus hopiensis]SMB84317.1 alkylhydroperoxidase AhpD family core domain-containing protein [Deinococcus hopiensis KR-140]